MGLQYQKLDIMTAISKELKNIHAQLKCAQSDLFFELKRTINNVYQDEMLHKIINEPFSRVNMKKWTRGLDGKKCYGVIDNYDPEKRDGIVKKVIKRLLEIHQEDGVWMDLVSFSCGYEKVGFLLDNESDKLVLRAYLENIRKIVFASRVKREKVRVAMN